MTSRISVALRCSALPAVLVAILAPALANGVDPQRPRTVTGHHDASPSQPGKAGPQGGAPLPSSQRFDSSRLEGSGSMLLEDIMGLVRQSPRLADEVASALRESGRTARDITCIGKRIDGRWRHLAGARVQPYVCRFGERWLEIGADLRIYGARGESYGTVSDVAARNAKVIRETDPRWAWTSARPRQWFLE